MKKPTHDLTSSKSLQKPEQPKSAALSTIPKRSLNPDVDAWVAAGGQIDYSQVIATEPQPKVTVVHAFNRDKVQVRQSEGFETEILNCNRSQAQASELLRTRIINCMRNHGRPMTPATVAEILRISRQKSSYHLSVMCKQGRVDLVSKLGSLAVYGVVK